MLLFGDNDLIDYCECIVPDPDNTSATHCGRCYKTIRILLDDDRFIFDFHTTLPH